MAVRDAIESYVTDLETYHVVWAAAGAAQDDDIVLPAEPQPPRELELYWTLTEYHCLLVAGGYYDQPAYLWDVVQYAGGLWRQHVEWSSHEERRAAAGHAASADGLGF